MSRPREHVRTAEIVRACSRQIGAGGTLGFLAASVLAASSLTGCGASSSNDSPGPSTSATARTAIEPPVYEATIDSARAVLRNAASEGVGVAAAVVVDGELVWLSGAGYADRAARRAIDPSTTRFRIYSVTKPMTAVAAARLMERGRLDPSAPVQRHLTDFPSRPEHPEPITPMHLATHTSGIRHYADDAEANSQRHCETVNDALSIFADDPLVHAPGAAETYSSWGYVVLSAVIEAVTGSSFVEAMENLVLEPAGMIRTAVDDPTSEVEGRATFYEEQEGHASPGRPVDNTCKWGAGAYLSTASDVARFGAAMLDPGFLSAPSLELFMQGENVYRAQGVGVGGAAFLVVERNASLSVALLSNTIGERAGPAAQAAAEKIHELFRDAR